MQVLMRPWGAMHVRTEGSGPLVLFANSLGTDLRLWDDVLPLLPSGLRFARFDKPGHGLSDLAPEVTIDSLADDAAALITDAGQSAVVVGLSIGGQIAQAVAARRPDLVRAIVLSNTAARLGSAESWQARIAAVSASGIEGIADAVLDRWFAAPFRHSDACAPWRAMLTRTPATGYIAACRALAASDLAATTAALRRPAMVIAGEHDGASPPDLVRATADLIPGAAFHVIPGAGHLPPVETPAAFAALLSPFLIEHAHA
ncbi:MAG: 3-oxoadipate enol-lactonase [Paracoccaceae bacterium]|nr:MAG: 3-oxoadipate enol-lactonase [Paracoccaceae bacterium]